MLRRHSPGATGAGVGLGVGFGVGGATGAGVGLGVGFGVGAGTAGRAEEAIIGKGHDEDMEKSVRSARCSALVCFFRRVACTVKLCSQPDYYGNFGADKRQSVCSICFSFLCVNDVKWVQPRVHE